jgi:cathepsin B
MRDLFILFVLICGIAVDASIQRPFMRLSWEQRNKFLLKANAWHHDSSGHNPTTSTNLPAAFDARKVWPECVHAILNQGDCGSCWAFAASEVLSDRFCILSNGSVNVVLSPQHLLSCEKENWYCQMGSLPNFAWGYLVKNGIVSMNCFPYTSGQNGTVPSCPHGELFCEDGEAVLYYKAKDYVHVGNSINPDSHLQEIMAAVMQGPVDVTFDVWGDFLAYSGGVYSHKSGSYAGLHSVKIIGWGSDASDGDYWIVANSWGSDWGPYGGYFLVKRGVDECFIEALVYTGTPLLPTSQS